LETNADTAAAPRLVATYRKALEAAYSALYDQFKKNTPIEQLVRDWASAIDTLILRVWELHISEKNNDCALIAVGGYGRGELHPYSDIDIMILTGNDTDRLNKKNIEALLTFLWDIGLQIGHSVRNIEQCKEQAARDVTIATTLMEARLLHGNKTLYEKMCAAVGPKSVWSSADFLKAKKLEQTRRYQKYHDTAYNLEPNIKEGPGGLRDIQNIAWVAKRHFNTQTLHELVERGFLSEEEYKLLHESQAYLWKLRFALHLLAGRREERLLFDYQIKLAKEFGYKDTSSLLGVEQFMQHYYRTVMELSRLNEMLMELLEEAILFDPEAQATPISDYFHERHGFLEASKDTLFVNRPEALLELFYLLQQRPELKGVSARTIRLIREHRDLVDDEFRHDSRNQELFMRILREPRGVTHELRRMNRYGILGRYIPEFGKIVGRMQYDLFHAYTVDEHTLFVVSNLRRFALQRYDEEFPKCSEIMQGLPKPELAYIAGLFHDIAKGRGGDHSELGAIDAESFCDRHGLSRYDARLVRWLVENHLLLSITAQKKDIADP
ncbi:MAG: [protein-PII] uridylyltransferase, partial [Gammaproteobacteria bacterium]|nr:[protein-PII] uridylyltransferase [Gammaproteobacteria bacterium]